MKKVFILTATGYLIIIGLVALLVSAFACKKADETISTGKTQWRVEGVNTGGYINSYTKVVEVK